MGKIFLKIAVLVACTLCAAQTMAQTCRVSCGVTGNGHKSYIEVYEYDFVSIKPEFPGGETGLLRFINNTRRYPKQAYKKGVQGRVTCSFVVNSDGSVSHVQILKGVESSLNAEAVRICKKMPAWTPGIHEGRAVPVRVVYPVVFRK